MTDKSNTDKERSGINVGISYGGAKDLHLSSHYHSLDLIQEYIAHAEGALDARKIQTLVQFAVAKIPNVEQGNKCIILMDKIKEQETLRISQERNHAQPTQDDIRDATINACMSTVQLLQEIMDTDCGIRRRFTVGLY